MAEIIVSLRNLLRLWFGLSAPVRRRDYILSGLALMAIKYCGEASLFYITNPGQILSVFQFLSPLLSTRENMFPRHSDRYLWAMALWALPFLWIGASMSVRRARDAGRSPWCALFFLVPFLNYLLMASLALLPSKKMEHGSLVPQREVFQNGLVWIVLQGTAFGVILTLAMTALSVYLFGTYGTALFFGTPFLIGALSAYLLNRHTEYSIGASLIIALWSISCAALSLLLFALEGIICIAMAYPLATIIG